MFKAHLKYAYLTRIYNALNMGVFIYRRNPPMHGAYDYNAPKKPANLSLNSDLLRKAKDYGLNLSAVMEAALAEEVKKRQREQWREENAAAIATYNEHVEENGVFSDELRSF